MQSKLFELPSDKFSMKMSSPFTHYVSLFGFAAILAYSFLVVTAHPAEEVSNEERKLDVEKSWSLVV